MFELADLKNDVNILKELAVTCLDTPEGEETPKVIIQINDKTRREEAKLSKKHNHLVYKTGGDGAEFITDKSAYLSDMVDACVKDSQGLFSNGGSPAEHDNKAFKTLLLRYPVFAAWFGNALTDAFMEVSQLKKAERDATAKN